MADEEIDLLVTAARYAVERLGIPSIVEIGSYVGKSTVALASVAACSSGDVKVYAVDPHEGTLTSSVDSSTSRVAPTYDRFLSNVRACGLEPFVEPILKRSYEVEWDRPIGLLFVDGLHDYENVRRDHEHFERNLADGALVAFHDYADYFPGVRHYVDELLRSKRYDRVEQAISMIVLRKRP